MFLTASLAIQLVGKSSKITETHTLFLYLEIRVYYYKLDFFRLLLLG